MRREQEYFEQDGDIYLLMSYVDGNPLLTDVYGVWNGNYILYALSSPEEKYVEDGMLMCIASDYDMDYDMEAEQEDALDPEDDMEFDRAYPKALSLLL